MQVLKSMVFQPNIRQQEWYLSIETLFDELKSLVAEKFRFQ